MAPTGESDPGELDNLANDSEEQRAVLTIGTQHQVAFDMCGWSVISRSKHPVLRVHGLIDTLRQNRSLIETPLVSGSSRLAPRCVLCMNRLLDGYS